MSNKLAKNMSWILVGGILESILGFFVSTITVRFLGPNNYGLINYAASLVAFLVPICNLGYDYVLVNEIINNPENEGEIMGTAIISSFFVSALMVIATIIFVSIINASDCEAILVCSIYSILLLVNSLKLIIYWFQAKLLSKYVTIISLISYCLVSAYKIYLLITNKDVYWFAISNSLDGIIIFVMLYLILKKYNLNMTYSFNTLNRMLKRSKYYIFSSLVSTVFLHIDQVMIKNMIDNESVGIYATAVTCCNLSYFVYAAIINSYRPLIFEHKKANRDSYKKLISILYSIIVLVAALQVIFMVFLAKPIILILYGNNYLGSVPILRILAFTIIFNQLGNARTIWILAENKQDTLLKINLIATVLNIILNYILIYLIGLEGAAVASLITYLFVNVISNKIIPDFNENNQLLIHSILNLKNNVNMFVKEFIRKEKQ